MARISLVVCDVCESTTKDTKRWAINQPDGGKVTLDLCETDEAPLVKLTSGKAEPKPVRKGRITVVESPTAKS